MEIRKAKPQDIKEIMNIINCCIEDMEKNDIHQWDSIYPNELTMLQDIKEQTLFLLIDEKTIKGFVTLNTDQPSEYDTVSWKLCGNKILVIHRLCINPLYKGLGLARKLLDFSYNYALEKTFSAIRLDAFPQNKRAIKLYERCGYELAGTVTFRKGVFNCYEKNVFTN